METSFIYVKITLEYGLFLFAVPIDSLPCLSDGPPGGGVQATNGSTEDPTPPPIFGVETALRQAVGRKIKRGSMMQGGARS